MITCTTCKARFATLADFDAHTHAADVADALVDALADELSRVSGDRHPMLTEPGRLDADESYTTADIADDLRDALSEFAPGQWRASRGEVIA